jgi:hypothetical protein
MSKQAGLCDSCRFSRVVESARGSRFYLCRLSETDARFAKYPPLPVLRCLGYVKASEDDMETQRGGAPSKD